MHYKADGTLCGPVVSDPNTRSVERVAKELYLIAFDDVYRWPPPSEAVHKAWLREADRFIAMVRRHDDRKAGKS
jgi:hypothetical protein